MSPPGNGPGLLDRGTNVRDRETSTRVHEMNVRVREKNPEMNEAVQEPLECQANLEGRLAWSGTIGQDPEDGPRVNRRVQAKQEGQGGSEGEGLGRP